MQQALLMYTTRTQALELSVSELQDDIECFLPRFDASAEDHEEPMLHIAIAQCNMELGAFYVEATGWRFDSATMRLRLGWTEYWGLDLHKTSPDGVILSIVPSWCEFKQPCSRHTLPLVVKRLCALDVPELPEDSRVALYQFLHAAAHILD